MGRLFRLATGQLSYGKQVPTKPDLIGKTQSLIRHLWDYRETSMSVDYLASNKILLNTQP